MVTLLDISEDRKTVVLEKWIPVHEWRGACVQAKQVSGKTRIDLREEDISKAIAGDVPFLIEFNVCLAGPANIDDGEEDIDYSASELVIYARIWALPGIPQVCQVLIEMA